jgi:hypothetical protein
MKIIAAFVVGLSLASGLLAAPAQAQATRTFVSPTGNDASVSCSLAAPCRTFAAAFALTNAGGEIAVLGTAGYGTLTINKAISIVNGGGFEAGIAVPSGGVGITINAGSSDAVSVRGLSIEGAGVGHTGIQFNTGKSLTVDNCVIRHFTNESIDFFPNAASRLSVSNSVMSDNNIAGIIVQPSGSAAVAAAFNRVQANGNQFYGILVDGSANSGTTKASVYDSVAAGNAIGFLAFNNSGSSTTLMLFHSVAADNDSSGVMADGSGAILRVAQSMVTGNSSGWVTNHSGVVQSYGDNYIDGNIGNQTAPPSTVRK